MIKKRNNTKIPKVLSEEDIEKLISQPSAKAATGIRNKATSLSCILFYDSLIFPFFLMQL